MITMDTRTKVELKVEPEGQEAPGPIGSFQIVRSEYHQERRSERETWRTNASQSKREVVADGITRSQLAKLIADAADWLQYIEEG